MIKDNNMFVYDSIHEIASSYQSKRHIKDYLVVWKLQNEPLSQNLINKISTKILVRKYWDTGREHFNQKKDTGWEGNFNL